MIMKCENHKQFLCPFTLGTAPSPCQGPKCAAFAEYALHVRKRNERVDQIGLFICGLTTKSRGYQASRQYPELAREAEEAINFLDKKASLK